MDKKYRFMGGLWDAFELMYLAICVAWAVGLLVGLFVLFFGRL